MIIYIYIYIYIYIFDYIMIMLNSSCNTNYTFEIFCNIWFTIIIIFCKTRGVDGEGGRDGGGKKVERDNYN